MKTPSQKIRESIENIKEAPLSVPGGFKGTTRDDRAAIIAAAKNKSTNATLKSKEIRKQDIAGQGLDDLPSSLFFGQCALTTDEVYDFVNTDDSEDAAKGILDRRNYKSPFLKEPDTKASFINVLMKNETYRSLVNTYLTDAIEGNNITKNQSTVARFLMTAEKQFENTVLQKRRAQSN